MKITVDNRSNYKTDVKQIKKNIRKALRKLRKDWDVGLFFVSKNEIKKLNLKYRRKNKPTDVLSFEMKENGYLGDVVISPEVAKENAKKYKVKYSEEIARLVIHGILHLLGHDHILKKDEKKTFKLQEKILREVWLN